MHKLFPGTKERTERRISAAASLSMCALTVLAQIVITLLLTYYLKEAGSYIYFLLECTGAAVAIWVYVRHGSPSYKLAWMCLLLALPVSGMILFCLWGGTHQAKSLSLQTVPPPEEPKIVWQESVANRVNLAQKIPAWGRLATYLERKGFPLYRKTQTCYFPDGAAFLQDLITHLRRAESYIFLEYYILAEGKIWEEMFAVLRERAAAGVKVYMIFDDFGNLTRLSDKTLQAIQASDIEVAVFNPVHRYVNRLYFNFRDHRKITVIDGRFAYTGGVNIADEYANLIVRFGHWKDTGVRLDGPGAWGFAAQFIQMWKMLHRSFPYPDCFYRPQYSAETVPDQDQDLDPDLNGWCQPFTDGPLTNPDSTVEDVFLQLIAGAQRCLYITTPYYAVEEAMQRAICIASDAGVDVRLLVPAIPDKKFAYVVAETYWGELLAHGVKIYKYAPGFIHAKSILVDREVALVGTTNLDYRTFQLQYECGVIFYQTPVVESLYQDLCETMLKSRPYILDEWNRRPWTTRLFAAILKLGAIWL